MVVKGYLNFLPVTGGNSRTTIDGGALVSGTGAKVLSGTSASSGSALSVGYLTRIAEDSLLPVLLAYAHVIISLGLTLAKCRYGFAPGPMFL